jgi:hypothetical protein
MDPSRPKPPPPVPPPPGEAAPASRASGRRGPREEMRVLEPSFDGPALELDLPPPPVVAPTAAAGDPGVGAAVGAGVAGPPVAGPTPGLPPVEAAPSRRSRPVQLPSARLPSSSLRPVAGSAEVPRFDRPPVVTLYSPVMFFLLLVIAGGFVVFGFAQMPFVSEALGNRMPVLGISGSVMSVLVGSALLVAAIRYHRSSGQDESAHAMSPGGMALVALAMVCVVAVVALVRGDRLPPRDADALPSIYRPAFRRAYVEQLKVALRDATIEVVAAGPGHDPSEAGATLRLRTDACSQLLVDNLADEPGARMALRNAGLGRVACDSGEGTAGFVHELYPVAR